MNNSNYKNKIIMAPMVRVGTLPMRLLAISYGADLVYTEELIDWKLLNSKRRENKVLGTVDFIDQSDGTIVFRTCNLEKDKVVMQIGTSCPERATKVGLLVQNDIAGIDINMGCPKEFSIKGGMGVALLSNQEKAQSILKALVNNLKIPVTCKIRIFPELSQTLELVHGLVSTGISAIGVHGRTRTERPGHPVQVDVIRAIAKEINIPVIANGGSREILKHSDILKFRRECGASSVMIARAAQWNVSIFRKDGLLPIDDVITEYLKLCCDYDNSPSNSKYCVQNILRELQETPRGKKFLESQTLEQICDIWNLKKYCRDKQLELQERGLNGRREVWPHDFNFAHDGPPTKRIRTDDVIEENVAFIRSNYINGKKNYFFML